MATRTGFNQRNPAVKRIMQEMKEMSEEKSADFIAEALENDIFEWHFVVRGPPDTEFEGGIYHGRILLPADYPFKPPAFMMLTPSGRFETGMKICLSISSHHPEHWQPSWSVRTALTAMVAFMPTPGNSALGSLDFTKEERRNMALASRAAAPRFGSAERQKVSDAMHTCMLELEKQAVRFVCTTTSYNGCMRPCGRDQFMAPVAVTYPVLWYRPLKPAAPDTVQRASSSKSTEAALQATLEGNAPLAAPVEAEGEVAPGQQTSGAEARLTSAAEVQSASEQAGTTHLGSVPSVVCSSAGQPAAPMVLAPATVPSGTMSSPQVSPAAPNGHLPAAAHATVLAAEPPSERGLTFLAYGLAFAIFAILAKKAYFALGMELPELD